MKYSKKNNDSTSQNFILFAVAAITLYFNSKFQDPFNAAKFIILIVLASWLIPKLFKKNEIETTRNAIALRSCIYFFILTFFISALLSKNYFTAFFGENSRKNGFITYLCLSIFALVASKVFDVNSSKKFANLSTFLLVILIPYGVLQSKGLDFVKWNNPYNAVILTLGNPNFASAILAILGVLFLINILIEKRIFFSFGNYFILIACIFVMIENNSVQGFLAFGIGIAFIANVYFLKFRKGLGLLALSISICLALLTILGLLQKGPLANLIYKDSISVRGFYWRAAIRMFKDNFWFGVGPDNYGNYFKIYREKEYPIRYGFEITSNNAHNVFLQFYSTCGFFVGSAYLILCLLTLYFGIRTLFKMPKQQFLRFSVLMAAWISYLAQSFVSIDSLGLAILGWVLNGVIIGIVLNESKFNNTEQVRNQKNIRNQQQILQPILSMICLILILVPVSNFAKSETTMLITRAMFNPNSKIQNSMLLTQSEKTLEIPFLDPYYKTIIADNLFRSGYGQESKTILYESLNENPNSPDVLSMLSYIEEATGSPFKAIELRKKLVEVDPWNANNYFVLARLLKVTGNTLDAQKELRKIVSFASKTTVGSQALIELQNIGLGQ